MGDKALFTFTIGPVKSFVENGRKMRDLYAGSSILSRLTSHVVTYLEGRNDIEVIFPKFNITSDEQKITSFPNRLVAYIESFDQAKHQEMAEEMEKMVRREFDKIVSESFEKLNPKYDLAIAHQQLKNFLEVYWLFEEYQEDYSSTYQSLFQNTHMVKSIRAFTQSTEPWGRKCVLHPEYNGIFVKEKGREGFPYQTNPDHIIDITDEGELKYAVQPNEAMSAIALVKRLYDTKTHNVSSRNMVLKKRLELTKSTALFLQLFTTEKIEETTHIVNALYDIDNELKPNEEDYPKKWIEEAKKLHEKLKDDTREKKIRLTSYYAILKFDGDNMGDAYKELKSKEEHTELSRKICAFATEANKIIKQEGGICIYAGGEDILAAMPIEEFWKVLERLHKEFTKQTRITFSAGVVIAHLMQPLKDVMNEVAKAEKRAKDYHYSGQIKNAFAVSLMKRSAETRSFRYSFDHHHDYQSLCLFENLIKSFKEKRDSKSTVYKINNLLGMLLSKEGKKTASEMMKSDKEDKKPDAEMIKSLIKHSIKSGEVDSEDGFVEKILNLYAKSEKLSHLMNTLDVASFLAREVEQYVR